MNKVIGIDTGKQCKQILDVGFLKEEKWEHYVFEYNVSGFNWIRDWKGKSINILSAISR